MIKYVVDGKNWPAIIVQEQGAGVVELVFFPAAATGYPSVVSVSNATYDASKTEGTWHHIDD